MKFSTMFILGISIFQIATMGFGQFLELWFLWAILFVGVMALRSLLIAWASRVATSNGAITKLQKEDERRYMPKELLEASKN